MTHLSNLLIFVSVLNFTFSASYYKAYGAKDAIMQSLPNSAQYSFSETSYIVGIRQVTWFEAFVLCQQNGMELVSITSKAEQDAIEIVLNEDPTTAEVARGYWISATRHGACINELVWFVRGKPVIYSKFATGQPDNAGGKEACVEVFLESKGKYLWNDLPCDHKKGYICQTRKDCCSRICED